MDNVFTALGFEFADFEDLLEELRTATDDRTYPVPGFEAAMVYQDPSGARLTAFEYEGEWTAVPAFRSGNQLDSSIYRVSPLLSMVELRRATDGEVFNQFVAVSDEAPILPGANPAGGQKLRADTLRVAAVGTKYTLYPDLESWRDSPDAYDASEPSQLYSPSTERFYQDFRPQHVNPYVRLGGVINAVDTRTNSLTGQSFHVCDLVTPAGILPLILPGSDNPAPKHVFHGAACMLASAGYWDLQLNSDTSKR